MALDIPNGRTIKMAYIQPSFILLMFCIDTFFCGEPKIFGNLASLTEERTPSKLRRSAGWKKRDDSGSYFDTFLNKPSSHNSHTTDSQLSLRGYDSDLPQKCGTVLALFAVKNNFIIKTKESMNHGAKFIASPHVRSNQECIDHCCSESQCTLSVYDGKTKSSCYLFECSEPNSCRFTEHSNYTSTLVQRLPPEPTKPAAEVQRESELEDLKQLVAKGDVVETIESTTQQAVRSRLTTVRTTTMATTMEPTTTTITEQPVKATMPTHYKSVNLLETCHYHSQCKDENAVCDNICICKPGMKPSYGKCALFVEPSVCNHLQFACRPHGSYTHCIASYDRCDGIAQCPLGDDEVGCTAEYPLDYTNKGASNSLVSPKKTKQQSHRIRATTPASVVDAHEPPKYSSSWADPRSRQGENYPEVERTSGMVEAHVGRKMGPPAPMEGEHGGRSEDPHRPPEIYDQVDKDIQDLARPSGWDEEPLSRKRPDIYDSPYSGVTKQGGSGYREMDSYARKNHYDSVYERPYGPHRGGANEGYRDYYDTRPVDNGYVRGNADGYAGYRNYQPYGPIGGPDDVAASSHVQRRPGVDWRRPTTGAPPPFEPEQHTDVQMPPLPKTDKIPKPHEGASRMTEEMGSKKEKLDQKTTHNASSGNTNTANDEPRKKPNSEKPATKSPFRQVASRPSKAKPESTSSSVKSKPQVTLGDSADRIILSKIEIERQNTESTFLTYDGDLQGAIVALTLGLTVTAILLIFVVCKLRSVKRRLRRGRPASNDVDYLIND